MYITMIETTKGSPDGIHVLEFVEGQSYDIPYSLAKSFVEHMGVAIIAEDPIKQKAVIGAPVNKNIESSPDNKGGVDDEDDEDDDGDENEIVDDDIEDEIGNVEKGRSKKKKKTKKQKIQVK